MSQKSALNFEHTVLTQSSALSSGMDGLSGAELNWGSRAPQGVWGVFRCGCSAPAKPVNALRALMHTPCM